MRCLGLNVGHTFVLSGFCFGLIALIYYWCTLHGCFWSLDLWFLDCDYLVWLIVFELLDLVLL